MRFNPLYCVYGKKYITQRCMLTIMLTFGICYSYIFRVVMSIALTEMIYSPNATNGSNVNKEPIEGRLCPGVETEAVVKIGGQKFNWTGKQQAEILGAFFVGYVITHIPLGLTADNYGGRHVLLACVGVSAVLFLLTPASTMIGGNHFPLMALRFLIGVFQGGLYSSATSLFSQWVPVHERGGLAGLAFAGQHLGNIAGNILAGIVIYETKTWIYPFYIWGGQGILWYFIALFTVFSKPSTHPFITPMEATYLKENMVPVGRRPPVPWMKILKSPVTLSLLACQIGHDYIVYLLFTDLPKYMKYVLKFNVDSNGYYSGLIFTTILLSTLCCGYVSDIIYQKHVMALIQIRRIQAIVSNVGPGLCLFIAGYCGCNRYAAVAFLVIGAVLMGPFYSGPKLGPLEISVYFSGTVTSIVNGFSAICGVATTQIVAKIAINHTVEEWRHIFWITFQISAASTIIYVTYFKPERAEWDYLYYGDEESLERQLATTSISSVL